MSDLFRRVSHSGNSQQAKSLQVNGHTNIFPSIFISTIHIFVQQISATPNIYSTAVNRPHHVSRARGGASAVPAPPQQGGWSTTSI